jgi:probable F420-dependent oxidoreductase
MAARKFRFGIQTGRGRTREQWTEKAKRIEDLGFSSLFIPDHFNEQLAPLIALMSAAEVTSSLRVGTMVLDNDYRHPQVLAMEAATLDLLSGGRLELGIGAGWMKSDYDASGIPYDRPGVRVERMTEAIAILKGLFTAEGPFSFAGKHYTITNAEGLPKPAQKPHPPILVGGGGKRVLRIAGREADIAGVNFNLEPGAVNQQVLRTGDAASTDEKIAWIRQGAGERFDEIELNVTVFVAAVSDDPGKLAERIAPGYGMSPAEVLESPHVLVGSVEQMVDTLQQRRERYGFSYVVFSGDVHDALAPVVAKLAGT